MDRYWYSTDTKTYFFPPRPPTPTEFDFDEEQATPKNAFINRRRTPGMAGKKTG